MLLARYPGRRFVNSCVILASLARADLWPAHSGQGGTRNGSADWYRVRQASRPSLPPPSDHHRVDHREQARLSYAGADVCICRGDGRDDREPRGQGQVQEVVGRVRRGFGSQRGTEPRCTSLSISSYTHSVQELQKTDKRNHEAYIRSGEVYEDREKNYEKAMQAWERGWASVNTLSELLGLVPPVLPSLTSTTSSSIVTSGTSSFPNASGEEIGGPGSLWQDEEDKKFYEELRELKGEVPGSVLGVLVEKEKEVEPEHVDVVEGEDVIEEKHEEDLEYGPPCSGTRLTLRRNPITAVDEAEPTLPTGPAAQLTALCARLLDASSKSMIDECAVEFAFLNSKAARKRLIRVRRPSDADSDADGPDSSSRPSTATVKTSCPTTPGWSRRWIRTCPISPRNSSRSCVLPMRVLVSDPTQLEEEFRYLQRKKQTDMAETRTKVCSSKHSMAS